MIENEASREASFFVQQSQSNRSSLRWQTFIASMGVVSSSLFEAVKWCAPASLAIYCTYEMVSFFHQGNKDAAVALEKILYVLIGGAALGWAVSTKKH